MHLIEIPASLAHKLTEQQREQLQKYANEHVGDANVRRLLVSVEKGMEKGERFDDALEKARKEAAAKDESK